MKLLLTSAGFTNKTIVNAFQELVEKPFGELKLVFIPTAANAEPGDKDWLIDDLKRTYDLGFDEMDILDFTGVPHDVWEKRIRYANIVMFGGGNTFHLIHSLETIGVDKLIKEIINEKVYVGISAGSMVASDNLALSQSARIYSEEIGEVKNDKGMGFVHFHVRPHLNSPHFPNVRIEKLEESAKEVNEPIYAIDDQTAIKVIGDKIEVVSEGDWKLIKNG